MISLNELAFGGGQEALSQITNHNKENSVLDLVHLS